MKFALARTGLAALGLGAAWGGALVMRWPGSVWADSSAAGQQLGRAGGGPALTADSLSMLVVRDPFRIARVPAVTPYDPLRNGPDVVPDQPPPPKPALLLSGILWGRESIAVLEGIPGIEGPRVVQVGDTVGGLTVRRILAQLVEVRGYDTTWMLTVREAWK